MTVAIEILSSTLVALGVGLLLAALMIRLVYGSWTRTQAITYTHQGHPYLRWHDHRYRIIEALWWSATAGRKGSPPRPPLEAGEDVVIYYHARRPTHWSFEEPYRGTRVLAVVGLVCAVVGSALGFLPG